MLHWTWKKLLLFGIGNLAVVGQIIYRLKASNPKAEQRVITPKNLLFGYIATTSSLSSLVLGYAQVSFFTNIPSFYPGNVLNKYLPASLDKNYHANKREWFNTSLFYRRFGLIALFTAHHSIFARASVKKVLSDRNILSSRIERSIYVIVSNLLMWTLMSNWNDKKPITENKEQEEEEEEMDDAVLWNISIWSKQPWYIQYLPGCLILMLGGYAQSAVISNDEFTGNVAALNVNYFEDVAKSKDIIPILSTAGFYSIVRHPQYLCNIVGFMTTPKMTVSRFTLSLFFLFYILIGMEFEEKGLVQIFGDQYKQYQKQVPQLIPTWPLAKSVQITV